MAERLSRLHVALGALVLAIALLPLADLELAGHDPWASLGRMARGFAAPDFGAVDDIWMALVYTVTFAVAGVALGASAGFVLAPFYGRRPVRALAVALRSVHELFWALFLMQIIGLGPMTGVLAIGLPYAGICAKVFSDYLAGTDRRPEAPLGPGTDVVSRFLWVRLPQALPEIASYTLYRLECGLRSSAVLGFVGLPTLGFQLDSFVREGTYGAAGAILIAYVAVIASMRLWLRWELVPLWIPCSIYALSTVTAPPMGAGALWRFLTEDIVPAPLRGGWDGAAFLDWLSTLWTTEALPGLAATLICGQIALALTGIVALAGSGLIVPRVTGRVGALLGHLWLVILRSLPEYLLAYIFLQALGPSMLPAILALGLHNGAIIAHLLGRQGEGLTERLRPDAPRGATLWTWELVPRLFAPFMALCLYRWEIILRETAVMGLLGIATLGFFVDSAITEFRLDRAFALLVVAGGLTAAVDWLSFRLRVLMETRGAVRAMATLLPGG